MKIPNSYQLLGHTINVVTDTEICLKRDVFGLTYKNNDVIILSDKVQIDESQIVEVSTLTKEHTFLHESVHMILHMMGEHKLNNNEKFVDTFAGLLHQMLITSKYE